ncbi:hypothetical protein EVAR_86496_1 [Eumeta japonica]|uniref:Uncharacterized protein n=1 Tax=Eumeta variegata TaxID=151549 RepID=A0A4C1VP83_EUMVA|nr:hypothetical protein EVAR_86496_1 [Eumeta japonica]
MFLVFTSPGIDRLLCADQIVLPFKKASTCLLVVHSVSKNVRCSIDNLRAVTARGSCRRAVALRVAVAPSQRRRPRESIDSVRDLAPSRSPAAPARPRPRPAPRPRALLVHLHSRDQIFTRLYGRGWRTVKERQARAQLHSLMLQSKKPVHGCLPINCSNSGGGHEHETRANVIVAAAGAACAADRRGRGRVARQKGESHERAQVHRLSVPIQLFLTAVNGEMVKSKRVPEVSSRRRELIRHAEICRGRSEAGGGCGARGRPRSRVKCHAGKAGARTPLSTRATRRIRRHRVTDTVTSGGGGAGGGPAAAAAATNPAASAARPPVSAAPRRPPPPAARRSERMSVRSSVFFQRHASRRRDSRSVPLTDSRPASSFLSKAVRKK